MGVRKRGRQEKGNERTGEKGKKGKVEKEGWRKMKVDLLIFLCAQMASYRKKIF